MPDVHPTAHVEDGAVLAADVVVGAFSFVGREVELGPGVKVAEHVTLIGRTRIGADCRIAPTVKQVIAAPFDGQLRKSFVRPGDAVREGDPLGELDNRELKFKEAELTASRDGRGGLSSRRASRRVPPGAR